MLHIHGLKDPVVPYLGCNTSRDCRALHWKIWHMDGLAYFPPVPQYIAQWRARNGIASAQPRDGFRNNTVSCQSWGSKPSNNVTLCVASDEGHNWPGATEVCWLPITRCTLDMDASDHILRFFSTVQQDKISSLVLT